MEKQVCDFRRQRIMIEDGERMELKHEPEASGLRRIYVSEDTLLPPAQQTEVNVRIARRTPRSLAFTGLLENNQVNGLPHVYSARSLIPAKFTGIKVSLLNSEKRSQIVPKDTDLGEVVEEVTDNPRKSLSPLDKVNGWNSRRHR